MMKHGIECQVLFSILFLLSSSLPVMVVLLRYLRKRILYISRSNQSDDVRWTHLLINRIHQELNAINQLSDSSQNAHHIPWRFDSLLFEKIRQHGAWIVSEQVVKHVEGSDSPHAIVHVNTLHSCGWVFLLAHDLCSGAVYPFPTEGRARRGYRTLERTRLSSWVDSPEPLCSLPVGSPSGHINTHLQLGCWLRHFFFSSNGYDNTEYKWYNWESLESGIST